MASFEEKRVRVQGFYQALLEKDFETLLKSCTEDVILFWGPYKFEGREKVKQWATEFKELFPRSGIADKVVKFEENRMTNDFVLSFIIPSGECGWLQCVGTYGFEGDKIQSVRIEPLKGIFTIKKEDLESRAKIL